MACGTPVIAFNNGSVPEVLEDGLTGFIVENEQQAIEAAAQIGTLDRGRIRAEFERRFTAQHMAQNYLKLYSRLAKSQRTGAASQTGAALRTGAGLQSGVTRETGAAVLTGAALHTGTSVHSGTGLEAGTAPMREGGVPAAATLEMGAAASLQAGIGT
jgi:hypothetical protein